MTAHPQSSSNTTPDGNIEERFPLTRAELHELNLLLESHIGIVLPDNELNSVHNRLWPRIAELRLDSVAAYLMILRSNAKREMPAVAKLLTSKDTYFFRETDQFEALARDGVNVLHDGAGGHSLLHILCAGTSSGEEVYTLKFFLRDTNVHITGWDINDDLILIGEKAEYRARSLRKMNKAQIAQYLTQLGHDRFAIKPSYRPDITFSVHNILTHVPPARLNNFDVIFCRNVLIYFTGNAQARAIDNFAQMIKPGGLLFLGHSESIIGKSSAFEPIVFEKGMAYRRIVE